jgi:excinuclease ABC subunit A
LNDAPGPITGPTSAPVLRLTHATRHNIKDLSVAIPLGRLVCITGVSGSGKTTLVRELLLPPLAKQFKAEYAEAKASDRAGEESGNESEENDSVAGASPAGLEGASQLGGVVLVDQSILGKTPRSNPAVYIGAFEEIRELFAQSEPAKQRGLNSSAFSFNSGQGQCERCRGAGFEKIEMQFLSDVFIRCADCDGRRYRAHILEVKIKPPSLPSGQNGSPGRRTSRGRRPAAARALSIGDLLESTVEEAIAFLSAFVDSRPALRAVRSLRLLEEVGLGYLRLGQPINTLSGGESQRLKLVRHLAEVEETQSRDGLPEPGTQPAEAGRVAQKLTLYRLSPTPPMQPRTEVQVPKPLLFLFDEPTTGLHFDDVRRLLKVFHRLVDAGHSVLVIEHNIDVIKSADWIIDLGPDAGDHGGQIVAEGTPEQVATCIASHTGQVLKEVLELNGHPVPARCE